MNTPLPFTAEQLTLARAAHWHQNDSPLLTLDSLRDWLARTGLVLYTPRPQQLPAPAPSFVQATVGDAPDLTPDQLDAKTEQARILLARLIAEGNAIPLNLLGTLGDTPDFIVSGQVFSYIFTLRGDKGYKTAPATAGAVKVSPLALRCYEILKAHGPITVSALVTEAGKEVTQAAVLRALGELWSQLRAIPLYQSNGAEAQWDLTVKRLARQIKSGTNAGLPTALSALISLYLGSAIAATSEEIEVFLSPLAPRSKIREVLNALTGARELDTVVLEGKTLLHVAGELPEFPAIAQPEPELAEGETAPSAADGIIIPADDTPRIKKFERKPGAFSKARPYSPRPETNRRPFGKPTFGDKPAYGNKPRPSFNKPWEDDRKPRPAAAEGDSPRPRKSFSDRPTERKSFGDRPAYGANSDRPRKTFGDRPAYNSERKPYERKSFSDKPAFEKKPYERKSFGDRPAFNSDRPRKTFGDRPAYNSDRPTTERKPYERKSFGDKPAFEKKPYERKSFSDRPAYNSDRPRKSFGDRPAYNSDRPTERKPYERKSFSDKPGYNSDRPRKPFGDKPFEKKPYERKSFGDRPAYNSDRPRKSFGDKPSYGSSAPKPRRNYETSGDTARPPRKSFDGASAERKPYERKSFEGKPPARSYEKKGYDKKPYAKKSFGDKPSYGGSNSKPRETPDGRPVDKKPRTKKPFGDKPSGGPPPGGRFGAKFGPQSKSRPGGKFGNKAGSKFASRPSSTGAVRKPRKTEDAE